MTIDPDHPIVRLLADGVAAELQGRSDEAAELYGRAWASRTDDYDAAMAAHYLARVQDTAAERFRWNQEAIDRAQAVGDDRTRPFLPSLYLNLGRSHEDLGQLDEARAAYALAGGALDDLPDGPYRAMIEDAVARGLRRTDPLAPAAIPWLPVHGDKPGPAT